MINYQNTVEEFKRTYSYLNFEVINAECVDGPCVEMNAAFSSDEDLCITIFPNWMAIVLLSEEDAQAFQGRTVQEVVTKLHLYLEGDTSVGMPQAGAVRVVD